MFEINPVLAGTFDKPGYAPVSTNLALGGNATEDANGVDTRRYTNFDRSAANAGSTTDFSFGDLLDLLNPLEHIPVISSIYRAVTGENINPVAHVAGDILYGGALGGVSALAGGVGAVSDSLITEETGKNAAGNVIAALTGTDNNTVQSETAIASAPPAKPASLATIAKAEAAALAAIPSGISSAASGLPLSGARALSLAPGQAIPLGKPQLPYGGAMSMGNAMQAQNMAIALAESAPHTMRLGHTIYTNRFMTGMQAPPQATPQPAPSAPPAAGQIAVDGSSSASARQNSPPQALINDMPFLQGLRQYQSMSQAPAAAPGSTFDTAN